MKKTPLDKQVSEDEFNSKKAYFLNSELQVELEFNKSLMNLSAGGLVLSVTFMQIFVDNEGLVFLFLLWVSWGLLLIATLLCLSFFKIVHKSLRQKHEHLEYMYASEPPERYDELAKEISRQGIREAMDLIPWHEKFTDGFKSFLEFLICKFSFIASALFITGIIVLISFVYLNL